MFDRFTDRARKAMGAARKAAINLDHDYIGVEHILLGLIEDPESVAGKILAQYQITQEEVKERLSKDKASSTPFGSIPFTHSAKLMLEEAVLCAEDRSHSWIGTEHLLHAIVCPLSIRAVPTPLIRSGVLEDLRKATSHALSTRKEHPTLAKGYTSLAGEPVIATESLNSLQRIQRVMFETLQKRGSLLANLEFEIDEAQEEARKEAQEEARKETRKQERDRIVARILEEAEAYRTLGTPQNQGATLGLIAPDGLLEGIAAIIQKESQ